MVYESMGVMKLHKIQIMTIKFFIYLYNEEGLNENNLVRDPNKTKFCFEIQNVW